MLEDWEQNHVYEQMIKNNEGKPQYILHDGPPYANGNIHMGTALNKIIKDIIIRYKNMSGFQAPYVPGYDTHGLPIELKALSSLGDKKAGVSKLELRQICKEFATEHIGVMNEQFKRLGVQGDFENPYLTLRPEFEARQVEIFGEMAKKGYIYKGMKAVYWCPEDRTALAEAEIEYAEDECDSIYVRFKLTDDPNGVLAKHNIPLDKAWIVIWTTTTWTLPANVATCLNPNLEYAFVKIGDAYHIMARELVEYTGNCTLFVVPYTKPQEYIRDNAPDVLFTVLMRRSMLRIANQVAKKLELQALITGESLAQVASQTMAALACTDQAQDLPVLRPCIGMDKIEIINISRKIGTFETSIEPYEDCCTIFTPPHPKTNPTLDEILAAEAAMPGLAALEAEAAENVEKIYIRMGDDELL